MFEKDVRIQELFDLRETLAGEFLRQFTYPWEALDEIGGFLRQLGPALDPEEFLQKEEGIWIAKSARVSELATLCPPLIIDEEAEIRPGAFLRGNVLVGKNVVVGNSTELKNVILFNKVQVPHYNYVGDSILGYGAHMGAGAITSNVKGDKSPVWIKGLSEPIFTNRKKVGAMLGDKAEIGCNSVLNPGTVIGRNTQVYPLSMVRGVVPANCIFKNSEQIVEKN